MGRAQGWCCAPPLQPLGQFMHRDLIAQASKRSQMIVVSHAPILVSALDAEANSRQIVLEKQLGETVVQDGMPPDWTWPSR
jgi:predicted ATPase